MGAPPTQSSRKSWPTLRVPGALRRTGVGEILAGAAARLQMSQARLYRLLGDLVTKPTRKRRSDAGKTALPVQEAQMIAAVLLEHMRKNGKMLKSVEAAVEVLRANNMIEALRINAATGEVSPLSISTIRKALRNYRLHPEQLLAPAPAMSLRSLHPNHVWQIDASRCVLFYLPRASKGDSGLRIMDHTDFYKNKPANVIKVINESLWRYVVTDHTSGWNYSTYVTGGENATNLVDVLIDAMHRREGEAMFGVPLMVMLDPGSANTSAIFKTCARRCGSTSRSTSRRTRARRARSKRARTSPSAISNPPCGCCRQTRSTAWRRSMRWWHVGAGTSTAPGSTRARGEPATLPGCISRPNNW